MRSTIVAVFAVFISSIAFAADFEARSEHYSLAVSVSELSAHVVVTDLATHVTVLTEYIPLPDGLPSEIAREAGDLHFALRLTRSTPLVTANLDVDRGEMEIDHIHGQWILAPRLARLAPKGALRVGGNVHAPVVIHRVEPQYPAQARMDHISGIVIIEARIDETGRVSDVMALKPLPEGLTEAAMDAVKQWVFQPGTLDGKPVPVIFNLSVNFKVDAPARVPPPPSF